MDSITQAVLGAAVGEATLGKKVGNKALLWGAALGTLPDLDVIPGQFMETVARISFHRGFSHSLLFAISFAPFAGWLIQKIHKKEQTNWYDWAKLFFWVVITHIVLDCFTTWGTQVFWPLDYRVAWNTIFVIDPLYTLPFLFFVIWLTFKPKTSIIRRRLGMIGLMVSSVYLLITVVNKQMANNAFENALNVQNIDYLRYNTKPTPLNSILWSATVETENGFYEGYYSLLDDNKNIRFNFIEKNHHLVDKAIAHINVKKLIQLTNGFYTVKAMEDGYIIYDLRFGSFNGWLTDESEFVFSYKITHPEACQDKEIPALVEQQRNVSNLDKELLIQFWERIKGV